VGNKLKELGFTVIRFSEGQVLQNIGEVHKEIYMVVEILRSEV
jgi:very-short-patch-repair endonuclease